jgi:hypothetical protein
VETCTAVEQEGRRPLGLRSAMSGCNTIADVKNSGKTTRHASRSKAKA